MPTFWTITFPAHNTSYFTEVCFKEACFSTKSSSAYITKDIIIAFFPLTSFSLRLLHRHITEMFLYTISYKSKIYKMPNLTRNEKKLSGKGLEWGNNGFLALMCSTTKFCQNLFVGKQIFKKNIGERLRNKMIRSTIHLFDVFTRIQPKHYRDDRWWQGGSGDECYRKWSSTCANCTSLTITLKKLKIHCISNLS